MSGVSTAYTNFERDAINALLARDDDVCRELRLQVDSSYVTQRVHTGVGMYVHIQTDISLNAYAGNETLRFQNVEATIAGLKYGAGFILWVENGKLSCLEVFTYQEELPKDIISYAIHRIAT